MPGRRDPVTRCTAVRACVCALRKRDGQRAGRRCDEQRASDECLLRLLAERDRANRARSGFFGLGPEGYRIGELLLR